MKPNEAPDKLYLHPTANSKVGASWLAFPLTNEDVEYTRTDAFIEKAADYIKKDMLNNLAFQGRLNRIELIDGIIEKFIRAMK